MSFSVTLGTAQQQLIQYVYPIWLVFGVPGCLLNLIIFSRPKLRRTSCCIYFFAASLDHLFTLIIGVGPRLYALSYVDPQITSLFFCKIQGYLFQVTLMLSRWFVVFACFDRYALSSTHVHLRNFVNRRLAYRTIAVIAAVWAVICSHRLIFYEIQESTCGILTNPTAAVVHTVYVFAGGGVLPAAIMAGCSLLIRRNLARKQRNRMHLSPVDHRQNTLDHQVLALLFIQIICYLIFTVPQLMNLIFSAISNTLSIRSCGQVAIERFVAFLAELMLFLFPVTSFYLYTLTSRTFRREFLAFLCIFPLFRTICTNGRVVPMRRAAITENCTAHQPRPSHALKRTIDEVVDNCRKK